MNLTKRFLADLAERMIRTFVQAFGAAWAVSGFDFDELVTWTNLKVGLAAAALSLLMSLGFKPVGNPESPSALPPELQPPAPIPADPDPEAPKVVPPPATGAALGVDPPKADTSAAWNDGYRRGIEDANIRDDALDEAYRKGVEAGTFATLKGLAKTPPAVERSASQPAVRRFPLT